VLNSWPAGADAHLETTLREYRERVRFPGGDPGRAYRGRIYPGAHADVGEGRGEGQRGARRRLPLRDIGHQQRRVAGVGDAAHAVSPRGQISSEWGYDPESERSRHFS